MRELLGGLAMLVVGAVWACEDDDQSPANTWSGEDLRSAPTPVSTPPETPNNLRLPLPVPWAQRIDDVRAGSLPDGMTMLVVEGPWGKGYGFKRLLRLRSIGGQTKVETLFPPSRAQQAVGDERPTAIAISTDGNVLWASVCYSPKSCDPVLDDPGRETEFFRSGNGGQLWESVGRSAGYWSVTGVVEKYAAVQARGQIAWLPPRADLPLPVTVPNGWVYDIEGSAAWLTQDRRTLIDANGLAVFAPALPAGHTLLGHRLISSDESLVVLGAPTVPGPGVREVLVEPYQYIAEVDARGDIRAAFVLPAGRGPAGRRPIAGVLGAGIIGGTFHCDDGTSITGKLPGLLDTNAGILTLVEHAPEIRCGPSFELLWVSASP